MFSRFPFSYAVVKVLQGPSLPRPLPRSPLRTTRRLRQKQPDIAGPPSITRGLRLSQLTPLACVRHPFPSAAPLYCLH